MPFRQTLMPKLSHRVVPLVFHVPQISPSARVTGAIWWLVGTYLASRRRHRPVSSMVTNNLAMVDR